MLPSTGARASRSPAAMRRAARSSRRSGRATWPAISTPAPRPSSEHDDGHDREAEDRPTGGAPNGAHALGHAHGAGAGVRRAGSGPRWPGCPRRASSCVGCPARCARGVRGRSPAGRGRRCPRGRTPVLSARSRPCPSTTITRPRTDARRIASARCRSPRRAARAARPPWRRRGRPGSTPARGPRLRPGRAGSGRAARPAPRSRAAST